MVEGAQFDAFRELLLARRSKLRGQVDDGDPAAKTVELDQTRQGRLSRMDAMQQQAMAVAAGERRQQELGRIEAALRRIADGDYGVCLDCGEEIARGRLKIQPTATRCVRCAEHSTD